MEDTETPCPIPTPLLLSDASMTDLIALLEAQLMASLDTKVAKLQSLQKNKSLEIKGFKDGVQTVLNSTQASLFVRTVPLLLGIPLLKGSLTTEDLMQKVEQTTETLKALCQEQARQTLAIKAAKVLEQIQAKEQTIRDQIETKQKVIAQLVKDKTKNSVSPQ